MPLGTAAGIRTSQARSRANRKAAPTEGHVIAELNLGFWRFLLARRYHATLWRTAVSHAFPCLRPKDRGAVEQPVIRLHKLRNRVAHLEPLLREDLLARRQDMLTVIGYICPDTRDWLDQRCRIPAVVAARP